MKKKTRFGALLLAGALTLSLVACGGGGDTPGDTGKDAPGAAEPAPVDPLAEAEKNLAAATSMDATMVMEMDMEVADQSMESVTNMDMTLFNDPMRMKVEMTMDMGEYGSTNMSIYAEDDGNGPVMYLFDGSDWYSQAVTEADLGQYNVSGSMSSYIDSTTGFTQAGTETVDGVSAYKYTGVISGESMQDVVAESGALDSFAQLGVEEDQAKEMLSGLGDITVNMWISEEDYYPIRYEMDMTAVMDGLMQSVLEAMGDQAEGVTMSVPKMIIKMTCSNFNNATDFTIPEEAKA